MTKFLVFFAVLAFASVLAKAAPPPRPFIGQVNENLPAKIAADWLEKLDEDDLEFLRQNLFIRPKLELNGKFTLLFFTKTLMQYSLEQYKVV